MLVTALAPTIGYDNAAKIAKTAHERHDPARGGRPPRDWFGGGISTAWCVRQKRTHRVIIDATR